MNKAAAKHPQIKFCGMRRPEDIALANQYQPDYLGLIFAPSKRQVSPEHAAHLVRQLDPGIQAVGVFVDETPATIDAIARSVGLNAVQLHGHETAADWQALRKLLPAGTAIWQKLSIPVDAGLAAQRVADYSQMIEALQALQAGTSVASGGATGSQPLLPDVWLLDTEVGGQSGGTGQTFPWRLLRDFAARYPVACAGGLNPDNVAAAILALQPAIVDCSSGIERNLEKQADLMAAFCHAVRD